MCPVEVAVCTSYCKIIRSNLSHLNNRILLKTNLKTDRLFGKYCMDLVFAVCLVLYSYRPRWLIRLTVQKITCYTNPSQQLFCYNFYYWCNWNLSSSLLSRTAENKRMYLWGTIYKNIYKGVAKSDKYAFKKN